MSMSKGACTYNRQVWEDSQFPILCETCLGDNSYMRMMVDRYGRECKICSRPFTTYRWCPESRGTRMRYKKTEICQTCSRAKNVCQTCLLDLAYNLPVQVRDQLLEIKDDIPKSDVNREYYSQNLEKQMEKKSVDALAEPFDPRMAGTSGTVAVPGKAPAPSAALAKLARKNPYYQRNRPHICSFWVKGECKRGEECPFRHEKPSDPDDPLSNQNMKDRYYGHKDPVAERMLGRAAEQAKKRAEEKERDSDKSEDLGGPSTSKAR